MAGAGEGKSMRQTFEPQSWLKTARTRAMATILWLSVLAAVTAGCSTLVGAGVGAGAGAAIGASTGAGAGTGALIGAGAGAAAGTFVDVID